MGKPRKGPTKKTLYQALGVYLAHADPTNISLSSWGRRWLDCHGETRSHSNRTFHIQGRLNSAGHYMIRIADSVVGGIEGTEIDWGTHEPSLSRVLRYYQALYGVGQPPSSSLSDSEQGDGGGSGSGGKGGGEGGGSGASGSGLYGPFPDAYGGYYYNDDKSNYYPCDRNGSLLESGGGYTEAAYLQRYGVYDHYDQAARANSIHGQVMTSILGKDIGSVTSDFQGVVRHIARHT